MPSATRREGRRARGREVDEHQDDDDDAHDEDDGDNDDEWNNDDNSGEYTKRKDENGVGEGEDDRSRGCTKCYRQSCRETTKPSKWYRHDVNTRHEQLRQYLRQ